MISTIGELFNLNHFDQSSSANDVIVIRHKDGSLHSSPFNVRFGRAKIWNSINKIVQIEVNGALTCAVMKIDKGGVAYWLHPTYGTFVKKEAGQNRHNSDHVDKSHLGNPEIYDKDGNLVGVDTLCVSDTEAAMRECSEGRKPNESSCEREIVSGIVKGSEPRVHRYREIGEEPSGDAIDLPLLEKREDGSIHIVRSAIHNSMDAQQARLPLQAIVEGKISQQQLSNVLVSKKSSMKANEEEVRRKTASVSGEAIDINDSYATPSIIERGTPKEIDSDTLSTGSFQATAVFDLSNPIQLSSIAPKKTNSSSIEEEEEEEEEEKPVQADRSRRVERDGKPRNKSDPSPRKVVTFETSDPIDGVSHDNASNPSVHTSDSDVSYTNHNYGNEDTYFLDPIENFVLSREQEMLVGNCSFTSSLTSGISVQDMGQPGAIFTASGETSTASASKNSAGGRQISSTEMTPAAISTPSRASAATNAFPDGEAVQRKRGDDVLLSKPATNNPTLVHKGPGNKEEEAVPTRSGDAKPGMAPSTASGKSPGEAPRGALHPPADAGSYFSRSLLPMEEDLEKLNLREGCNRVRYLARKTPNREVVAVECNIFLWDCTARLVVSDIDGTITKSDLWGHFYQAIGKGSDWTHPGTCSLFTKIVENGYKMVYLSARSVAQIEQTKKYLWSLEQDGVRLPLGPVLTAPQRIFSALTQELAKRSYVFKIACMEGLRAAFPAHARPFFAGFGNRSCDLRSYAAVGIPPARILIIDPTSTLRVCQVRQTYRNLAHLVDVTFPRGRHEPRPRRSPREGVRVDPDFSAYAHWRLDPAQLIEAATRPPEASPRPRAEPLPSAGKGGGGPPKDPPVTDLPPPLRPHPSRGLRAPGQARAASLPSPSHAGMRPPRGSIARIRQPRWRRRRKGRRDGPRRILPSRINTPTRRPISSSYRQGSDAICR